MKKILSFIFINPNIRSGKPCIKNTRIAVSDIFQWLGSGMSYAEILKDYSLLTEESRPAFMLATNKESMIKTIA